MMMRGKEAREKGAAGLSDHAGAGGAPIGITIVCMRDAKLPRRYGSLDVGGSGALMERAECHSAHCLILRPASPNSVNHHGMYFRRGVNFGL